MIFRRDNNLAKYSSNSPSINDSDRDILLTLIPWLKTWELIRVPKSITIPLAATIIAANFTPSSLLSKYFFDLLLIFTINIVLNKQEPVLLNIKYIKLMLALAN